MHNDAQTGENARENSFLNYKSAAPPFLRFALWFARQAFSDKFGYSNRVILRDSCEVDDLNLRS